MRGDDHWERGAAIERAYAETVTHSGGIAMPLCAATGNTKGTKAPMMTTVDGLKIAPDFLLVRRGRTLWAEVKGKCQPSYHFKSGRWEHGLDWHLVAHYSAVQRESGAPVWIVVHEAHSPASDDIRPRWAWRHMTPMPCCTPSGLWLCVSLDDAMASGGRRAEWPNGRGGRYGQGGLLWPRAIMRKRGEVPTTAHPVDEVAKQL